VAYTSNFGLGYRKPHEMASRARYSPRAVYWKPLGYMHKPATPGRICCSARCDVSQSRRRSTLGISFRFCLFHFMGSVGQLFLTALVLVLGGSIPACTHGVWPYPELIMALRNKPKATLDWRSVEGAHDLDLSHDEISTRLLDACPEVKISEWY